MNTNRVLDWEIIIIFFRSDNSILFQWLSVFNFKRREKSRGEILLGLPLNNGSLKNVHIHLST